MKDDIEYKTKITGNDTIRLETKVNILENNYEILENGESAIYNFVDNWANKLDLEIAKQQMQSAILELILLGWEESKANVLNTNTLIFENDQQQVIFIDFKNDNVSFRCMRQLNFKELLLFGEIIALKRLMIKKGN